MRAQGCREQEALAKCVIQFDDFTPTDLSSNAFAPSHHTCTNSCVDACVREALEAAASGPQGPLSSICLVGGVDVSFDSLGRSSVAGLVVLSFPDLRVVWEGFKHVDLRVPYRAGFLAFREVEPFRALLRRCESAGYRPDVTLVDGNGVLHARRCGSATHLGEPQPASGQRRAVMINGQEPHTAASVAQGWSRLAPRSAWPRTCCARVASPSAPSWMRLGHVATTPPLPPSTAWRASASSLTPGRSSGRPCGVSRDPGAPCTSQLGTGCPFVPRWASSPSAACTLASRSRSDRRTCAQGRT